MKQRSLKDTQSLTALPEYSLHVNNRVLADAHVVLAKRELERERFQLQLQRSTIKKDNSIEAVRKSLSVVDNFYKEFYSDAMLPTNDANWDVFPADKTQA